MDGFPALILKTNFLVGQDNWILASFFYAILLALTQFITTLKRTRPISSHYDRKSWDNNAYMDWCWVNNAYMDWCCIKHCFMGECLTEKPSGMRDTCISIADQVIFGKEISIYILCTLLRMQVPLSFLWCLWYCVVLYGSFFSHWRRVINPKCVCFLKTSDSFWHFFTKHYLISYCFMGLFWGMDFDPRGPTHIF